MTSSAPLPRALVILLVAIAGWVDAIGFLVSGGLFVSFMSGNSTQASVDLGRGAWLPAVVAGTVVVAFVVGVGGGRVGRILLPRVSVRVWALILAGGVALAAVLVALWPTPGFALAGLALTMGSINTLFAAPGQSGTALTYATGMLVSLGIGVAEQVSGRQRGLWRRPLATWTAIVVGAVAGGLAYQAFGIAALGGAVLGLLGVAGVVPGPPRQFGAPPAPTS